VLRRARRPDRSPSFVLLSRAECHLCEEMEDLLREILPAHGLDYSLQDVDADASLQARYGEVVPVLLRDGKPVAKVRLDRKRLERILRRHR
jgi:hypothetical protein